MSETLLFDEAWYFHKGEVNTALPITKPATYRAAKTARALVGPACKHYAVGIDWQSGVEHKSEEWMLIDLPHDYMLGYTPDRTQNEALGYCKYENAWYVKHFALSASDADKRITFLFEGIAGAATVYINGCLMKRHFCGYTSFEVDATDVVEPGADNVISVYVSTQEHEGWWYEGGGIYRHVWMHKTDAVSIDLWGVFADPQKQADGTWSIATELSLRNDGYSPADVRVRGEILDGDEVVCCEELAATLPEREIQTLCYRFLMPSPKLWSPESPTRYTMRTSVLCGEVVADVNEIKFGCRTYVMDPDRGLFINGKPYKIKGVCAHENMGLTGKYLPDNIQRYRVQLLREMGANGYRTAHYPHSEAMMEALDENGFIVMDETRWFESTEEGLEQLTMLIKRDRNRPSVFFWSVGNEEEHHVTDVGRRICRAMVAHVRKLDPSRAVLTAVTHDPKNATVFDDTDVVSINYKWNHYDDLRQKYPHKPFLAAECAAAVSTRGQYLPVNDLHGIKDAYDKDTNTQLRSREYTWQFIAQRPWVMGGYQWSGFEYMGESTQWPRICSVSGAIDLFLQKKDAFYQNQSHWLNTPMVHLLPHWNWQGMEGHPMRVVAYTNAPRVELLLNGTSLGVCTVEPNGHAEWMVPYEAGELKAIAYGADGERVAEDVRRTTGEAKRLRLTAETRDLKPGDVALLTCSVTDEEGNEVPDACPTVAFYAQGVGSIYATGSSVTDHQTVFSHERKMWMGKISVALRLAGEHGKVCVYATAQGLQSTVLELEI